MEKTTNIERPERTPKAISDELTGLGLRAQDLCIEGRDSLSESNPTLSRLFESLRSEAEAFYGKANTLDTEVEIATEGRQ